MRAARAVLPSWWRSPSGECCWAVLGVGVSPDIIQHARVFTECLAERASLRVLSHHSLVPPGSCPSVPSSGRRRFHTAPVPCTWCRALTFTPEKQHSLSISLCFVCMSQVPSMWCLGKGHAPSSSVLQPVPWWIVAAWSEWDPSGTGGTVTARLRGSASDRAPFLLLQMVSTSSGRAWPCGE